MEYKPIIGITPRFSIENNRICVGKGYTDAILAAGGLPFILPVVMDEEAAVACIDRCDGILLSGGPDVDARLYGEANMNCNGEISPHMDFLDILAAKRAIASNKPVLGICRGVQVINIALGGSVYQDIFSQLKDGEILKHTQQAPLWFPVHDIDVKQGTKVFNALGKSSAGVNSFHHQAVKALGDGLEAVAWSTDGIIEAVEHAEKAFVVGVQWHPEIMWQENREHLRLFEMFVNVIGIREGTERDC